jgi:hypothetical protein
MYIHTWQVLLGESQDDVCKKEDIDESMQELVDADYLCRFSIFSDGGVDCGVYQVSKSKCRDLLLELFSDKDIRNTEYCCRLEGESDSSCMSMYAVLINEMLRRYARYLFLHRHIEYEKKGGMWDFNCIHISWDSDREGLYVDVKVEENPEFTFNEV